MFAAVTVNWIPILGIGLIVVGLIGGAIVGGLVWYSKRSSSPVKEPVKIPAKPVVSVTTLDGIFPEKIPAKRGADDPAPPGAIEWVQDIVDAMSAAGAPSKLEALLAGSSRNMAQLKRIKEVEAAEASTEVDVKVAVKDAGDE